MKRSYTISTDLYKNTNTAYKKGTSRIVFNKGERKDGEKPTKANFQVIQFLFDTENAER